MLEGDREGLSEGLFWGTVFEGRLACPARDDSAIHQEENPRGEGSWGQVAFQFTQLASCWTGVFLSVKSGSHQGQRSRNPSEVAD